MSRRLFFKTLIDQLKCEMGTTFAVELMLRMKTLEIMEEDLNDLANQLSSMQLTKIIIMKELKNKRIQK